MSEETVPEEEETTPVETALEKEESISEETAAKETIQKTIETENVAEEQAQKRLEKVTDLKWSENGEGKFINPNEEAAFTVCVMKDGEKVGTWRDSSLYGSGKVTFDLYHLVVKSGNGTYTFQVNAVADGYEESGWSELSPEFEYTVPDI